MLSVAITSCIRGLSSLSQCHLVTSSKEADVRSIRYRNIFNGINKSRKMIYSRKGMKSNQTEKNARLCEDVT